MRCVYGSRVCRGIARPTAPPCSSRYCERAPSCARVTHSPWPVHDLAVALGIRRRAAQHAVRDQLGTNPGFLVGHATVTGAASLVHCDVVRHVFRFPDLLRVAGLPGDDAAGARAMAHRHPRARQHRHVGVHAAVALATASRCEHGAGTVASRRARRVGVERGDTSMNLNLRKADIDAPPLAPSGGLRALWRRRVLELAMAQLRQGITPRKIALTIALGVTLGLFPILGTTTV